MLYHHPVDTVKKQTNLNFYTPSVEHLSLLATSCTLRWGVKTTVNIPIPNLKVSWRMNNDFDVIVVGGGHAGVEAAHAAAKMGSKTLLVTLDSNKIATMPCNPSIGGLGKGHIVFEVSALGGLMPQLCTATYLQARMLNTKKGPAVQGLRLQIDKFAYSALATERLRAVPNLTIAEHMVMEVLTELPAWFETLAKGSLLTTSGQENNTAHPEESDVARRAETDVSKGCPP